MDDTIIKRIKNLSIWQNAISIKPLDGGITNINYIITDGNKKYVARLGQDIIEHQIMQFNVLAASKAAYEVGLSPAILYASDGLCIMDYIESKTLIAADVCNADNLKRILPLLKSCHTDVARQIRGPALIFWVFHVIRNYVEQIQLNTDFNQNRITELLTISGQLEHASGPYDIVFCHNDLLAANILDDGERLWLIDWDYAGFNSPLFDLGGLASNNGLNSKQEIWLLENYFETAVNDDLLRRYYAMKCASTLRETLWSMVSQINPSIDFDYEVYTDETLKRFHKTHSEFLQY